MCLLLPSCSLLISISNSLGQRPCQGTPALHTCPCFSSCSYRHSLQWLHSEADGEMLPQILTDGCPPDDKLVVRVPALGDVQRTTDEDVVYPMGNHTSRHILNWLTRKQTAAFTWMPKNSLCRTRFPFHSELHLFVDFCPKGCAIARCRVDQPGQVHPCLARRSWWVD